MIKNTFLLLFLSASNLFAQEPNSIPSDDKFAAIVQYSNAKEKYNFKDIVLFNETIKVPDDSYIKIITQKRCIAVLYKNTVVQSPVDRVSPWKIISGDARWICSEDKVERISVADSELQVQNGELLINGKQLTVLKNSVRFQDKDLNINTVYAYKNTKWLPLKNQPDPYTLWNKQERFPAPLESVRVKTEKPEDPYVKRVFLNLAPVGLSGVRNHELKDDGSDLSLETHAFRLGTNFPWKNKSVLVFLEYSQGESGNENTGYGPPPVGYKSIKFEATTLGIGLRHNHINSSSFYYYLGLTHQKYQMHQHPSTFEYYDTKVVYPLNISAGGGYQKIFWSKNWVSLMVGVDLKIIQSLTKGKVDFFNQPFNENKSPEGLLTEYSSFVYLGPVFNF